MPQEEASATVKKCAVDVARCESKAGLVEMDSEELRKVCLPSAYDSHMLSFLLHIGTTGSQ